MAIDFDGVNDYAEITDNDLLDIEIDETFLVGFWVYADSVPLIGYAKQIISKWDEASNKGWAIRIKNDGSGNGRLEFLVDIGSTYTVEVDINTNKWEWYLCGRLKSGSSWRLYIAYGTSSFNYTTGGNGDLSNTLPLRLGSRSWSTPSEHFDGKLGRLIIVRDLYEGFPGNCIDWDILRCYPASQGGGNLLRTIYIPQKGQSVPIKRGKSVLYLQMNEIGKSTIYDKASGLTCNLYNGANIIHKFYGSQALYPKWFG